MAGKIIALLCCILCAIPFFVIPALGKESNEPISFWTGDDSLRSIVTNVPEYNRKMGILYKFYGVSFIIAGIGFLFDLVIGTVILCLDCTLGIFIVYRVYKTILRSHS